MFMILEKERKKENDNIKWKQSWDGRERMKERKKLWNIENIYKIETERETGETEQTERDRKKRGSETDIQTDWDKERERHTQRETGER